MQKMFKSGSTRVYLYLIVMIVVAAGWRAGEWINRRLAELPIHEAPRAERNAAPIEPRSFSAVWVKQSGTAPRASGDIEVDSLFRKKEEPKVDPPKAVVALDYAGMFRQAAQVDGVADDGVFVNGRFYKIGEKLHELAVAAGDVKPVVPVLESIKGGKVTFRVGAGKVSFTASTQG